MKKQEFLSELKSSLKKFDDNETKDILCYYDEMISEKVEQGQSEESVIASLGGIKAISSKIKTELVNVRLDNNNSIKSTSKSFFTVLMLCASPALIPLGLAFFAVFFALFVTIFALVISFFVTSIALTVALIPAVISGYLSHSTLGALVVAAVFTILIGVFGILSLIFAKTGSVILKEVIRFTGKLINRKNNKGVE